MSANLPAIAPQTFTFTQQAVRVIVRDGEPWFVAADVCAALGIANATQAMARLDDDETTLYSTEGQAGSGPQSFNIINESGLYSLILGSRKPEAKRFKKWVTSEVLPAIRKTGQYTAPTGPDAPYHRISPEQEQALSLAMHKLCANWLFNHNGTQHVHNHLRTAFSIRTLADLPATDFERAIALIESKQEAMSAAVRYVAEFRAWFERECLSGGTPWTPSIVKRLTQERGERVPLPPRVDWAKLSQEGKP
jgi:prophage antirepressor-like protein